nr:Chain A, cyclic hexapeptide KKWWKF [synthetic construct]
KKWWKF